MSFFSLKLDGLRSLSSLSKLFDQILNVATYSADSKPAGSGGRVWEEECSAGDCRRRRRGAAGTRRCWARLASVAHRLHRDWAPPSAGHRPSATATPRLRSPKAMYLPASAIDTLFYLTKIFTWPNLDTFKKLVKNRNSFGDRLSSMKIFWKLININIKH